MNVLWKRGPATVAEITDGLKADPPLAYNTVLTTLRILESKGFVRHKKESRAFIYEASVAQEEASRSALRQLLARFFNNSPELLVANLLKDEQIRKRDLERVRKLIAE
ncbi:MAG: BlaI/MecI/CopY family transcriptional regulator [Acidobacteriaceae bacterium]|nr:BlaI/MecI/CopY family transcriptional regulator [Acidobacteriaceae bacterium]